MYIQSGKNVLDVNDIIKAAKWTYPKVKKYAKKVYGQKGKVSMPFQYPGKVVIRKPKTFKSQYKSKSGGGKFQGKTPFLKKTKNPLKIFSQTGSIMKQEYADEASSRQSCFILHNSLPARKLLEGVSRALIRKLFKQAGISISNWEEPYLGADHFTLKIVTYYYKNSTALPAEGNTDPSTVETTVSDNQTFSSISTGVLNSWTFLYEENVEIFKLVLLSVESGVANRQTLSQLEAKDIELAIYGKSTLTFQNATHGESSVFDNENADNVSSNPVRCQIASSPNWSSGYSYANKVWNGTVSNVSMISNITTGCVDLDSLTGSIANLYKINPSYSWKDFSNTRLKNSVSLTLDPGVQKKDVIKTDIPKINLNNLIRKFQNLSFTAGSTILPIGHSKLLSFEHTLRDNNTGESALMIPYQNDLIIAVKCNPKAVYTNTITEVLNTV